MANGKLVYEVGFRTNQQELQNAVKQAQKALNSITQNANGNDVFNKSIQSAMTSAQQLSQAMKKAFNINKGVLDLTAFRRELEQSGVTIGELGQRLSAIGPEGRQAFLSVTQAIQAAQPSIKRTSEMMDKLWITMKNTMRWQLSSMAIRGFMGALQTCYGYAQDLNKSLNNIRIVTGQSTEQMARFSREANNAAKQLSTTTLGVTDAALIYYQQGLNDEQVAERTETTLKLANVSRQSAEEVSSQLTAIWNNFDDGTKKLEYYADAITALGATTASSSSEIAGGIEKFASVAKTVGLSYEYAASALATIVAATRQSEDTVGTGLRTILGRIESLNLGETLEDDVDLTKYTKALAAAGVYVLDQNNQLKEADVILDELGSKWQTLSDTQKTSLAYTIGGVRQYTNLIALMDNWSQFQTNVATATNSEGTLEKQQEIYAEGWEASSKRVRAAAEDIYSSLINEDFFINFNNHLAEFLKFLNNVIDGVGGLKGVLQTVMAMMFNAYGPKIQQSLDNMILKTKDLLGIETKRNEQFQKDAASASRESAEGTDQLNIVDAETKIIELQREYEKNKDHLTARQEAEYQIELKKLKVMRDQVEALTNQNVQAQKAYDIAKKTVQNDTNMRKEIDANDNRGNETEWKSSISSNISQLSERASITQSYKAQGNIENKQQSFNRLIKNNKLKASDATHWLGDLAEETGQLERFEQKLISMQSTFDATNEDTKALAEAFEHMTGQSLDITNFDSALQQIQQLRQSDEQLLETMTGPLANAFGINEEKLQQLINAARQAGLTTEDFEQLIRRMGDTAQEAAGKLNETQKQTMSWSQKVVTVSRAVNGLSMAINGLKNLGSIWNNDDLTTGEKLIQIISTLGTVIMGLNSFVQIMNVLQDTTIVKSILTHHAKKLEAKGYNTATAAAIAYKLATRDIVAIAALVIGAVVGIVAAMSNQQSASDKLKETVDSLTQSYKDLNEELDKFKDLKTRYQEAVDALKELEQGTDAYKEKLKEANEIAKEIVENNKELSGSVYIASNGLISFQKDTFDNYQKQQEVYQANNELALNQAQIDYASAKYDEIITELKNRAVENSVNPTGLDEIERIVKDLAESGITDVNDAIIKSIPGISDDLKQVLINIKTYIPNAIASYNEKKNSEKYYGLLNAGLILGGNESYKNSSSVIQSAVSAMMLDEVEKLKNSTDIDYNEPYKDADGNRLTGDDFRKAQAQDYARAMGYDAGLEHIRVERDKIIFVKPNLGDDWAKDENKITIAGTEVENFIQNKAIQNEIASNPDVYIQPKIDNIKKLYNAAEQLGNGLGKEATEFIKKQNTEIQDLAKMTPLAVTEALSNTKATFENLFSNEEWQQLGWQSADEFIRAYEDALIKFDSAEWLESQVKKLQGLYDQLDNALDLMQKGKLTKKEAKEFGEELQSIQKTLQEIDPKLAKFSGINNLENLSGYEQAEVIGQLTVAIANQRQGLLSYYKKEAAKYEEKKKKLLEDREKLVREDWADMPLKEAQNKFAAINKQLEETEKHLEKIKNTKIGINVDADTATVDAVSAKIGQITQASNLIEEGYKVKIENIEALASILPQIFDGVDPTKIEKGMLQLNKTTIKNITQQMKDEVEAVKETSGERLKERYIAAQEELDIIQKLEGAILDEDAGTVEDIIDNQKISKDEQIKIATDILTDKIEKEINKRKQSAQSSSDAITDAELAATESAKLNQQQQTNYENMFEAINTTGFSTYKNLIDYESAYVNKDTILEEKAALTTQKNDYSIDTAQHTSSYQDVTKGMYADLLGYIDVLKTGKSNNIFDIDENGIITPKLGIYNDTLVHGGTGNLWKNLKKEFSELGYDMSDPGSLSSADAFLHNFWSSYDSDRKKLKTDLNTSATKDINTIAKYFADVIAALEDTDALINAGLKKNESQKKAKKEKEKEIRYKEIENEIKSLERVYDKISDQIDRSFGTDKINAYTDAITNLQQRIYAKEQEAVDIARFVNGGILSNGELVEEGDIAELKRRLSDIGLEDAYALNIDWQNGMVKGYETLYNKIAKEREKAYEADPTQDLWEYDYAFDSLEQIMEDVDKFVQIKADQAKMFVEIQAQALKQLSYTYNLSKDLSDAKKEIRAFKQSVTESSGTVLDWGMDSLRTGMQNFNEDLWQVKNNKALYDKLLAMQADPTSMLQDEQLKKIIPQEYLSEEGIKQWVDSQAFLDLFGDLRKDVLASGDSILQWIDQVENMIPNAINEAAAQFGKLDSKLQQNIKTTQSLSSLYSLVANAGLASMSDLAEMTEKTLGMQGDAYREGAKAQYAYYNSMKSQYDDVLAKLEDKNLSTIERDYFEKQADALLTQVNAAQDAMYDYAQKSMEAYQQRLIAQIDEQIRVMDKAVSNGLGLDYLEESLDRIIAQEENYLDVVNKKYELDKLYRTLQENIDKTTSAAATVRLKALEDEFRMREANNELSEYDLEIMNAKLEMTLKQMALEDAQNAKSDLRLVRNAQGNWTYQYMTNQDDINKAQQDYDNAVNNWYNTAKDKSTSTSKEIVALTKEMFEKLDEIGKDGSIGEEERQKKLNETRKYYLEQIQYQESEKTKAVQDMTEAGITATDKYTGKYIENLNSMSVNTEALKNKSQEYIDNINTYWSTFKDDTNTVIKEVGLELVGEDGESGFTKVLDKVAEETGNIWSEADALIKQNTASITAIRNIADAYRDELLPVAQKYLETIQAIAMQELHSQFPTAPNAGLMPEKQWELLKNADIGVLLSQYINQAGENANEQLINNAYALMEKKLDEAENRNELQEILGAGNTRDMVTRAKIEERIKNGYYDDLAALGFKPIDNAEKTLIEFLKRFETEITHSAPPSAYAETGGYTGEFTGGRLAWLHSKELVLNASDTENMMHTVELTRDFWQNIGKELDTNALTNIGLILTKLHDVTGRVATNESVMQQEVTIHAEFPNVQDSREIELALNNLINDASQYINK